jgi:hypothetical protein
MDQLRAAGRTRKGEAVKNNHLKNNNCDNAKCTDAYGEVRLYPLGGGANLILCHACWEHENRYRLARGRETGNPAGWPQLNWSNAEVYKPSQRGEFTAEDAENIRAEQADKIARRKASK